MSLFSSCAVKDDYPTRELELYQNRISVNCHGPWILLYEAGLPFTVIDVDLLQGEQSEPDFIAMNPCHSVPTFKDADGTTMWEGNAIMRFLCRKYPSAEKFYPVDPHVDLALDWRLNTFYKHVGDISYARLGIIDDEIPTTNQLKEMVQEDMNVFIDFFLQRGRKPFIGGSSPCIADFAIAPTFKFLRITDVKIPRAIEGHSVIVQFSNISCSTALRFILFCRLLVALL
jgi:glutathione S-transferase